jgi:hypothetical protein
MTTTTDPQPKTKRSRKSQRSTGTKAEAAEMLGIHEFSVDVLAAFGVPGTPPLYGEIVETLADVAKAYGVSERTVAGWRARGMPGESGCFSLNHIERWRKAELQDAPRRFPERAISDDLVRAVFDYVETEARFWVLSVLHGAMESELISEDQRAQLAEKFAESRGRVCPPLELRERILNELATCFQPPCD